MKTTFSRMLSPRMTGKVWPSSKRRLSGKLWPAGSRQGPARQPVEAELRDIDEHQAGEDLVRADETRLEERRDRRVGHSAEGAEDQHHREDGRPCQTGKKIGGMEPKIAPTAIWPSAPMFQLFDW